MVGGLKSLIEPREEVKNTVSEESIEPMQQNTTKKPLNLQSELFSRFRKKNTHLEHYDAEIEERKQKLKNANKPTVII